MNSSKKDIIIREGQTLFANLTFLRDIWWKFAQKESESDLHTATLATLATIEKHVDCFAKILTGIDNKTGAK